MWLSTNDSTKFLFHRNVLVTNEAMKLELFDTFVEENGSEKVSNTEFLIQ